MKYLGIEGLKYLCNKISTALKNAEIKIQNHSSTSASTSVSGHVKFGTTSGTACQGNDSRLSDARTPKSHTHDDRYYTESEVDSKFANISTDETLSEAGKPADAGAVGIKLNEVKDSIRSVEASLGSHDHDSQYIKLSGGTFDSGTSFTFVNGNGDTVIDVNNPDTNDYVHIQAEGISATGHLIGNVSYSSVTFDSNDTYKNPTAWQEVDLLGSQTLGTLFKNVSGMMANVRWMKNQIGSGGSIRGMDLYDRSTPMSLKSDLINLTTANSVTLDSVGGYYRFDGYFEVMNPDAFTGMLLADIYISEGGNEIGIMATDTRYYPENHGSELVTIYINTIAHVKPMAKVVFKIGQNNPSNNVVNVLTQFLVTKLSD